MKRPSLVHFISIQTEDKVSVRASVVLKNERPLVDTEIKEFVPTSPLKSLDLLSSSPYQLKIVAKNSKQETLVEKVFDSDSFGNFNFNLPLTKDHIDAEDFIRLQVYELKFRPGLELLIGNYIPLRVFHPKKIVVSDFDKTLVDTRYSTTREVYQSMTKPVSYFPAIDPSIELLKSYIHQGHQPFILTASPHFYEEAIRDWLYQHEIFTAGILLKDYRKIFSWTEGDLTTKDLKSQGFYKLNHLVNILIMTGIPDELVLLGDGFESDPLIYLILEALLNQSRGPRDVWNNVRSVDAFRLTPSQNSRFLNKLYQLASLTSLSKKSTIKVKIHIRKMKDEQKVKLPSLDFIQENKLDYYIA